VFRGDDGAAQRGDQAGEVVDGVGGDAVLGQDCDEGGDDLVVDLAVMGGRRLSRMLPWARVMARTAPAVKPRLVIMTRVATKWRCRRSMSTPTK
jgi:hypothetical protein